MQHHAYVIDWPATDLEVAAVGQRHKNGAMLEQMQHQRFAHSLK